MAEVQTVQGPVAAEELGLTLVHEHLRFRDEAVAEEWPGRYDEQLELEPQELAILDVLMLRGPQTVGELRTRTERLHPFADRAEVEDCLRRMASRPEPLVRELERQEIEGLQKPAVAS